MSLIKYAIADGTQRCAKQGCSRTFVPKKHTPKGRQCFCSPSCKGTDYERRKEGRRTMQSKLYDTCPSGHDRSPENVRHEGNGNGGTVIRCRECKNAKQQRRRARLKAAA